MERGWSLGPIRRGAGSGCPGRDQLLARLATADPCPITLVEDTSADREWAPLHSHPWDELTYVLEGVCPTPLRVLHGTARFLMLTVGAPSLGFLREVGEVYATGPTLERLVEVAGLHGVRPAFDLPDA